MRIRYAQGWQWTVEVDGLNGFDMFVKDITYSSGNIETESKVIGSVEFSKPTYVSAGPVTMTVRDTEDGKIMDWFKERRSRVTNPDGTINLPPEYLMKIRVYRVTQDGGKNWKKKCAYFLRNLGKSHAHVIRCQSSCHTQSLSRNTHPQAQVFLLWSTVPLAWLQVR